MTRGPTAPRTLAGVETEYALTAFGHDGRALSRAGNITRLLDAVKERVAHSTGKMRPFMGGPDYDIYLGNGSRVYVDAGLHPEWSTPECTNPTEVVTYVRAGEQILSAAARDVRRAFGSEVADLLLFKCNVDYLNMTTWGCHESYLHREPPTVLARQIIPHLVSRVVFTGPGGLNPRCSGIEFALLPRVFHLEKEISGASTGNRGIYHTKNEKLASGRYNRLHVICGESLCSQVADYLRIGTTALVVLLVDGGWRPGKDVTLGTSLSAMCAVACDVSCDAKLPMRRSARMTAVEIQRRYLRGVERRLGEPYMPDWAEDVCRRWRAVLDALDENPDSLATMLDWPLKLALFKRRARQLGIAWASLEVWNRVIDWFVERLPPAKGRLDAQVIKTMLRAGRSLAAEAARIREALRPTGLTLDEGVDAFLALRRDLCALDHRFGQLGSRPGIFAAFDEAGTLGHRIVTPAEVDAAQSSPPPCSRARARGRVIQELTGQEHVACHWTWVRDHKRIRFLDLSDPFSTEPAWKALRATSEGLGEVAGPRAPRA